MKPENTKLCISEVYTYMNSLTAVFALSMIAKDFLEIPVDDAMYVDV